MVKEELRSQILRAYARLSEQAKIRQPKSLHYLLQLYTQDNGGDVPQMLQYFVEQEKLRSRKRLALMPMQNGSSPDQLDDFLLDTTNNQ